jgi:uncharacterized coiled-coil protein SlyX
MAIVTLLLLGVGGAAAQSLGDYARAIRKDKAEPSSTTRHYDNDNLPATEGLSVVGPAPEADANAGQKAAPVDSSAAAAARQKTADEWNDKIAKQKAKVDSLNHEIDLSQRELRVRAAALYSDPSISARSLEWNKDDAKYRSEIETKQKDLDAARQQLDEMQEQAHKAGIAENAPDKDNNKTGDKDNSKDNNKDKE